MSVLPYVQGMLMEIATVATVATTPVVEVALEVLFSLRRSNIRRWRINLLVGGGCDSGGAACHGKLGKPKKTCN